MGTGPESVNMVRVIEKLDGYLDRRDYDGAERHLHFWLEQADDPRVRLSILNELIGLYRKTLKEKECLNAVSKALQLAEDLNMKESIMAGTSFLNAATGYKAFGRAEEALRLYKRAEKIYELLLAKDDSRLAGLYNNMAVTLADLCQYDDAEKMYNKELDIMRVQENGKLEMAVTYLNMADLYYARQGPEESEVKVNECLDLAESMLDSADILKDGYYAFICEKCAPAFNFYGRFLMGAKLLAAAGEIEPE